MKEIMVFDGQDVKVKLINNQTMFEVYSTGMALGYVKFSKGRAYAREDRIDTTINNAEIATVVHDGQLFMTESQLYDFMLEAKTDKCKSFKKWVTNEVLPQINITGGYIPISESDDELMIMTRAMQIMQKTVARKDDIIAMQQPKVQAYESLMDSRGNVDFAEFVKSANLSIGRNTFMSILRDKEILRQNNEPYQHFMKYFEVIQTVKGTHSFSKTLINKLGMDWLIKKCVEWEITN